MAPNGGRPTCAGHERRNRPATGITATATAVTTSVAVRQPYASDSAATTGRKISWPVALAAVSTPVTRPRRATNQRIAMVATKAVDREPVPRPTRTPQSRTSCHASVMNTASPVPAATSVSAPMTTGRTPSLSMSAAENGAVSPKSAMFTDIAAPIVACDQPNSRCSGSIITPGTDRNPAAPSIVTKATPATIQA